MKLGLLRTAAVLALAVLSTPLAAQAPYPNQSIRFIVPFAPGGLPDTVARITAQHLQERIGQSVVVENRAGGGASAAATALLGSPADGYTFMVSDGSLVSSNAALFKQLAYNPKDMIPVALLGQTPLFLAAHPDLPVSSLREFVDYVKARPGEINYGSSGVGSIHHISMEAMQAALGLKMTHVPYRGTGQSVPALLGGHVPVLFSAYPSLVGAVESKKVKLLANNGPTRWPQAPDVPPIADVIPGYDLATIVGIYARPGVPQPILDKIATEAVAAINTPEAKRQMTSAGIAVTGGDGAVFDKALKREIENVNKAVKAANIEPQ
ncbi:tripartite tricarboxylate transporter substrate binding protein [Leptospira sp. severe_002]|uniref:Bug family tripartite tricarboxylate transporter substrate binding protein n=1 Tax=Leptospira sp. severe_002 TaxID=2838237 RepID=UPI001E56539F|nr:tripartite tricarboxylate transporter substrate binding protein [Leptospira sp. severe_002]